MTCFRGKLIQDVKKKRSINTQFEKKTKELEKIID